MGCFVKKKKIVSVRKAAGLNSLPQRGQPYWCFLFSKESLHFQKIGSFLFSEDSLHAPRHMTNVVQLLMTFGGINAAKRKQNFISF
jgi:hypothetical protein